MRRWWIGVAVLGAWTVPGLMNAAQYYIGPDGGDWMAALLRGLPRYYLWALLTPLVAWLARRFRPERGRWARPLAAHAAAAAVVSSLHLLLGAWYYWVAYYAAAGQALADVVTSYFSTAFAVDYVVYWAVLAAVYAFDYFQVAQERELRATRLEARLAEARLQALERQLDPHFLFNALHAISALALRGDGERTVRTITRLGDLLRLSLRRRGSTVPLRDEIELVERYLDIERARFIDRLCVEYRIEPESWDAAVPAFLLQPLVENAIRHGIAASPAPATLAISARAVGGELEIDVRDSGPGPAASTERGVARDGAGIGLENTRARLRELYGDGAALELGRHPAGGGLVRVRLPLTRIAGLEEDEESELRFEAVVAEANGRRADPDAVPANAAATATGPARAAATHSPDVTGPHSAGTDRMRVVIVDDEPLARRTLRQRLDAEPDVDVVAECGDGAVAVRVVENARPDLLFLDVRMPGMDGFDVLRALPAGPPPGVVFVTAYDDYAIRAFDVHAVDYLLKPFDDRRFERALRRARARIALRSHHRLTEDVLAALRNGETVDPADDRRRPRRITVKDGDRVYFVATREIRWIESVRNYVRLHTRDGGSHLLRGSLKELGGWLDPAEFVRIHRSTIVGLDAVREVQRSGGGDDWVVLDDGTRLKVSRGYRDRLLRDTH